MTQALMMVVAAISAVIADSLTKELANNTSTLAQGVFHWLMAPIVALYLIQSILFIYLFQLKWELGRLCIMQMAIIGVCAILIGCLYFGDKIQPLHAFGMALSMAGVILMNL